MFNLSEIMKEAHSAAKENHESNLFEGWTYQQHLAAQLRRAWANAKVSQPVTRTKIEQVRYEICILENKRRWTQSDYLRADKLNSQLRAA